MSVRSEYDVDKLRAQIIERRDTAIKAAKDKCEHDSDLTSRRAEWREQAEASVRSLHRKLKKISDSELESFRIRSAPASHSYRTPEEYLAREVSDANESCDRALRRLDAIKSNSGVLQLTPSMLRDLFSL